MSTTFNPQPARDDLPRPTTGSAATPATGTSRTWAVAGLLAGVAGIVTIGTSLQIDAVYDSEINVSADRIAQAVADNHGMMSAYHVAITLCAVLLVPFAIGLARRLRGSLPADSALPGVAAAGLLITSGVMVLAGGLDTEFIFTGPDAKTVPEISVMYNHWIGTTSFLWVAAGISGLATFAAFRRGAVARWIGLVGLVLGGLAVIAGISTAQYAAGFVGPLWVLITSLGFLVGDRSARR